MYALFNRHVMQPMMAWRSGSRHLQYLRGLRQTQYDNPHVIQGRQTEAIRRLLFHAYETVPYYRQLFIKSGFHPSDFDSLSDLSALPVLTKADIRKHHDSLLSSAFAGQSLYWKKTSG